MPKIHLRKPEFTYIAWSTIYKDKERIQTFKETGDLRYIYQNELDEACIKHDTPCGEF